jgi:hypothetical protein
LGRIKERLSRSFPIGERVKHKVEVRPTKDENIRLEQQISHLLEDIQKNSENHNMKNAMSNAEVEQLKYYIIVLTTRIQGLLETIRSARRFRAWALKEMSRAGIVFAEPEKENEE